MIFTNKEIRIVREAFRAVFGDQIKPELVNSDDDDLSAFECCDYALTKGDTFELYRIDSHPGSFHEPPSCDYEPIEGLNPVSWTGRRGLEMALTQFVARVASAQLEDKWLSDYEAEEDAG